MSPSLSLIDPSLNKELSSNYHLSYTIGLNGFSYCIIDLKQNRILAIEEHRFLRENNYESLCNKIKMYIGDSSNLNAKFKNISVGLYTEKSTLMPAALYDENRNKELFKLNFSGEHSEITSDLLQNTDVCNVYETSQAIKKTFGEIYSKVKILHFSSPLIESLFLESKFVQETRVYLHFLQTNNYGTSSRFELIIFRNGKLIFVNSYMFYEKEDIAYYLLFALEQLNITAAITDVILIGNIQKTDEFTELINKYVRNVDFGNRPGNFEYSNIFDELPSHFYYALLSQYLFV